MAEEKLTPLHCPTCDEVIAEVNLGFVSEETLEAFVKAHWHYDCKFPPKPAIRRP